MRLAVPSIKQRARCRNRRLGIIAAQPKRQPLNSLGRVFAGKVFDLVIFLRATARIAAFALLERHCYRAVLSVAVTPYPSAVRGRGNRCAGSERSGEEQQRGPHDK